MKYSEILEKAKEIENDYILLRKPTKNQYGYAVRMTSDPVIEISRLDDERSSYIDEDVEINEYKYIKKITFQFPVSIAVDLSKAINDLINREM